MNLFAEKFNEGGVDDNTDGENSTKYNVSLIRPRGVEQNLPNLLYYKCTPKTSHDYVAPFLLRKASHSTLEEFDENDQGHEIVPPSVVRRKSSSVLQKAKAKFPQTLNVIQLEKDVSTSTLKTTIMKTEEKMTYDSDDEEFVVDDDEKEQSVADDAEKMETEENDEVENEDVAEEDEEDEILEYNSHALIQLEPAFYITMDWISSNKYPVDVYVNVTKSISKISQIPSTNSEDREVTLENCLHAFNEPEVLGPQNCW